MRSQRWLKAGDGSQYHRVVSQPRFCSPNLEKCRSPRQSLELGAELTEVKTTLNSIFLLLSRVILSSMAGSLQDCPWSSWVFTPLCNPLPLSAGGPSDLLLVNRIQQKWWDVASKIRLYKAASSTVDSLILTPSAGSQPPCCDLPKEESLGRPFANSPCPAALDYRSFANTCVHELGNRSSLGGALTSLWPWCHLIRGLESETPS